MCSSKHKRICTEFMPIKNTKKQLYHETSALKRRCIDTGVLGTPKCIDKPSKSSWCVRIKQGSDCERCKRGNIHSNFDNVSSIF